MVILNKRATTTKHIKKQTTKKNLFPRDVCILNTGNACIKVETNESPLGPVFAFVLYENIHMYPTKLTYIITDVSFSNFLSSAYHSPLFFLLMTVFLKTKQHYSHQ